MTMVFAFVGMVIAVAGVPVGVLANLLLKPTPEDR